MEDIIRNLTGINKGLKSREIEGILHILVSQKGLTISKLITLTGIPQQTLVAFIKTISQYLNAATLDLTSDALETFKTARLYKFSLLSYLGKNFDGELDSANTKYRPNRDLDQFFATAQTSKAKALILEDKGLNETYIKIAFLGDDDLVSTQDTLKGSLSVFDIDPNLLSAIEHEKHQVDTIKYDALNELPEKYVGKFDVVVTDPPYTRYGIELFLNRAIYMLNAPDKYIFLYYGNSFKSPEKFIKIQEIINRYNLVIEDKIDKFARYFGAESIGNASSLYVLKTTPTTRAVKLMPQKIYSYQAEKEERFPYVDHVTAKVTKVPVGLLNSKKHLINAINDFCQMHKLKVVDKIITQFKGKGLTISYVLSNSNLTVHTWPELEAIHVDLITCSPIYNKDEVGYNLGVVFNTKQVLVNVVE